MAKEQKLKIHYTVDGPEKTPVILFSHSLASAGIMWEPQAQFFKRKYRVLRIDTRGHGKSDVPPSPYTFSQMADDFLSVLDSLSIEKVHFVGLSMGGMIGQELALRHPDRLLSLTLSDTFAKTPSEIINVWEQRIAQAQREGLKPLLDGTMSRWFTERFREERSPLYISIEEQFLATPVEGYIGAVHALMKLDNLDRLSSIRTPTLVIVGEEDPGTPIAAAQAMHTRIHGSSLSIIPKTRHLPNIEQPEQWNKVLDEFLSQVSKKIV